MDIYNQEKLTWFQVLQFILLGTFIPMVTGAMIIEFLGDMLVITAVIPFGFWYTAIIYVMFMSVMVFLLFAFIHKGFKYLNITGNAKMIADISYIITSILVLSFFNIPAP